MPPPIKPVVPTRIKVTVTAKVVPINWNSLQQRAKPFKMHRGELSQLWQAIKEGKISDWNDIDRYLKKKSDLIRKHGSEGEQFFDANFSNGLIVGVEDFERQKISEDIGNMFKGMQPGEQRTLDLNVPGVNELTLTETIMSIFDALPLSQQYIIEMNGHWLPLNQLLIEKLEKFIAGIQGTDPEEFDSFTEIFKELSVITSLTIQRLKPSTKNYSTGGFFSYFNNTDIDLTKQQIIKFGGDRKIIKDSCFIYVLDVSGKFSSKELNQLRCHFGTRNIDSRRISDAGKQFGFKIMLTKPYKDTFVTEPFGDLKSDRVIPIGKLEGHYFLNEKVSAPAMGGHLDAYYVIRQLIREGKFTRMTIMEEVDITREYYKNEDREIDILTMEKPKLYRKDNGECFEVPIDYRYLPEIFEKDDFDPEMEIWCADFEAYHSKVDTEDEGKFSAKQLPILLVASRLGNFEQIDKGDKSGELEFEWFKPTHKNIKFWFNQMREGAIVYFHNLKYDITQLLRILPEQARIIKLLPAGGSIISCTISYFDKSIEFRCSYKLTVMSIADLAKGYLMSKVEKEMCPYPLFNDDTINKDRIPLTDVKNYYGPEFDKFMKCASDYCSVDDNGEEWFYLHRFNLYYCKRDVEILHKSLLKFYQLIKAEFKMNCFQYLTAPSLADTYFKLQGCYKGVVEFGGIAQLFMRRAVVGGRCMTRDNKPHHVVGEILDMDNNSLYPAAMSRIDGFAIGIPEVLNAEPNNKNPTKFYSYDKIKSKFKYYILEVDVISVKHQLGFPLLSAKDRNGVRQFSNDIRGRLVIDKYALEDAIEHQGLEFKIIRGYVWREVNNKINSVIRDIYSKRLDIKAEAKRTGIKNPVEQLYKLLMNSSYGKTIMKVVDKDTRIVEPDQFDTVVSNNFQNITGIIKITSFNSERWAVTALRKTNKHFSRPQCGAAILSMSKRIMNEPMCLAEKNGMNIYYQDTDSMQIDKGDYEKLEALFHKKYDKELSGDALGQFSTDYEGDQIGVEGYFLAKKLYGVRLNKPDKDGHMHHLRAKGIPNDLMKWEDYEIIHSGKTITKNLLAGGRGLRTTGYQARIIAGFNRELGIPKT